MNTLDVFAKDIEGHEGRSRGMYLDNRGFVTVGVGFLVESVKSAHFLPFWNMQLNTRATNSEIDADFARVAVMPANHHASFYRGTPRIELTDAFIDTHLRDIIVNRYIAGVRQKCPNFDSFPLAAQRALIDCCYGLGVAGFGKFGNLIDHCNAGDWKNAAVESHISSRRPERNDWVKGLFLEAAKGVAT